MRAFRHSGLIEYADRAEANYQVREPEIAWHR
jgi:hypothetical protein